MKTVNLLGLEISKETSINKGGITQTFNFEINGVMMQVTAWALKCNNDNILPKYSGFCETWNHCIYALIPAILCGESNDEFSYHAYDLTPFYEGFNNEETYQERLENGYIKTGVDYQHGYNNASNTDLLTVLSDAIQWAKTIANKINSIKNN